MDTYTTPKPFEDYPGYQSDRTLVLSTLDVTLIDNPLVGLIKDLNRLPHMFTLQCCYGHFLTKDGEELFDFTLSGPVNKVEYRLAYIAFCIENSPSGKMLTQQLKAISSTGEKGLVQFCSAKWFWNQWLNSYVLQVMPQRFKGKDSTFVDFNEAAKIKQVRDLFFMNMKELASP